MKKISLISFLAVLFFMSTSSVNAQIGVNVNLNLQPNWGPAEYNHVEYYYLPQYDMYYYAPERQFVYRKGSKWLFSNSLPYQYRNANLYSTYKVVINEPKPYMRHAYYAEHYKGFKHSHPQQKLIRDSKDSRNERKDDHTNNKGYDKQQKRDHISMPQKGNDNRSAQRNDKKEHSKGKGNNKH